MLSISNCLAYRRLPHHHTAKSHNEIDKRINVLCNRANVMHKKVHKWMLSCTRQSMPMHWTVLLPLQKGAEQIKHVLLFAIYFHKDKQHLIVICSPMPQLCSVLLLLQDQSHNIIGENGNSCPKMLMNNTTPE